MLIKSRKSNTGHIKEKLERGVDCYVNIQQKRGRKPWALRNDGPTLMIMIRLCIQTEYLALGVPPTLNSVWKRMTDDPELDFAVTKKQFRKLLKAIGFRYRKDTS